MLKCQLKMNDITDIGIYISNTEHKDIRTRKSDVQ
jgi:hypothetical protein